MFSGRIQRTTDYLGAKWPLQVFKISLWETDENIKNKKLKQKHFPDD